MSNEDFWKKAGEAIDAQIKELAEKRAINTAKYLNESHAAARKEMNHNLIERLNTIANEELPWSYPPWSYPAVCREAIAEIERLELEIKDYKGLVVSSNDKYNEAATEIERLEGEVKERNDNYNVAVEEIIRLNKEVVEYKETIKRYENSYNAVIVKIARLQAELDSTGRWDNCNKNNAEKQEAARKESVEKMIQATNDAMLRDKNSELRDQFACVVLQGFYANAAMVEGFSEAQVAEAVYEQADAMLKAREK